MVFVRPSTSLSTTLKKAFHHWRLNSRNQFLLLTLMFILLALVINTSILSRFHPLLDLPSSELRKSQQEKHIYPSPYPHGPHPLQYCVDEFTTGQWINRTWVPHESSCNFRDLNLLTLFSKLDQIKIGFFGDSTIRSDFRAFAEKFNLPPRDLYEAKNFMRLKDDGSYVCDLSEQSINLTKCGQPIVLDLDKYFRYFYKVYPYAPLDKIYLNQTHLFKDLNVVVISIGRWLPYGKFNLHDDTTKFLTELGKVFHGKNKTILFVSEYPEHVVDAGEVPKDHLVKCEHELFGVKDTRYDCSRIAGHKRYKRLKELRQVMVENGILFLDRWNMSRILPEEHFQDWFCGTGKNWHTWTCDHMLGFVAMQHWQLLVNVLMMIGVVN